MSKGKSHNRNPRRMGFLAAREAFWKAETSYWDNSPPWRKLWLMYRGKRPLPMAFRLPKNGSKMRFVGPSYHPSFPLHKAPEQAVSRLHRPGHKPVTIWIDEAKDIDAVVWAGLERKDLIARQAIADAYRIPAKLIGKS